ncbi:MAG TPA: Ig-like domain-containing protein [Verrucomicrobiae bacterium]|nr:Ig-like domain-containing protein [Verrucomicrobiae bacterium]
MKWILRCGALAALVATMASAQVIVGDNYNVSGNGTGFDLNTGVNSGINPPVTRLTGTAATNLRYMLTALTKSNTAFSISGNKLRVTSAANPGRFSLSADGVTPFDFAPVLGTAAASPASPVVYDLAISMANNSAGNQRCSFALGTAEGDATMWAFGIQLYRTAASDNFYTIGKRIDMSAAGLTADLNSYITNTPPGTAGSELHFLIRVTDAGPESSTFTSRVQVSMDGGLTWFYDTSADPDLPNGWHLNGPGRVILWDIAPNAGAVTYDDFSVRPVPISAALTAPADGAQLSGVAAAMSAAVSNQKPGPVTVTFYTRQPGSPFPGPDFLIPVLPDTQNYARQASGIGHATKEMWYSQTEWIITNRVSKNIAYVAQLGDIVQNGDINGGSPNEGEWQLATNAMYRLENPARTLLSEGIPYGCSVGNHDQEPNGDEDGTTTLYNKYFGINHFGGKPYYGGHYGTNNDSFYDLFSASGLDFIIFSYEFGRYGSGVLGWTEDVLANYPNRRIIAMMHYAGSDCGGTSCSMSPAGQAVYNQLKTHPNFFLMMGGHVFNGNGDGEGSRSDTYNGATVHTLVSDFQGRTNGGNGLMRLMYFSPSNNLVSIKTYSPYTDEFETDANSQFSFGYNMQLPGGPGAPATPFVSVGTNADVASGATTTFTWRGGQPNTAYEWYAKVTDTDGNTFFTPTRTFVTASNAAPIASNITAVVIGDRPNLLNLAVAGYDSDGDPLTFKTNGLPIRGLNTAFDPNTGLITYTPARGYRGFDRFTFSVNDGFSDSPSATFNLNVVAPDDTNADGIADDWEAKFGITDPAADNDADGQSNLAEYLANTNPTNSDSALRITGWAVLPGEAFQLTWASVGGTRYRVQYSDSLAAPFINIFRSIDLEMDPSPHGSDSTQTFIDDFSLTGGPPAAGARYYRVIVSP